MGIETTGTAGNIYTDKTKLFSVKSGKDNKFVFVLYCYDAEEIIIETLKDKRRKEILRDCKKIIGIYPTED